MANKSAPHNSRENNEAAVEYTDQDAETQVLPEQDEHGAQDGLDVQNEHGAQDTPAAQDTQDAPSTQDVETEIKPLNMWHTVKAYWLLAAIPAIIGLIGMLLVIPAVQAALSGRFWYAAVLALGVVLSLIGAGVAWATRKHGKVSRAFAIATSALASITVIGGFGALALPHTMGFDGPGHGHDRPSISDGPGRGGWGNNGQGNGDGQYGPGRGMMGPGRGMMGPGQNDLRNRDGNREGRIPSQRGQNSTTDDSTEGNTDNRAGNQGSQKDNSNGTNQQNNDNKTEKSSLTTGAEIQDI